MRRDPSGDGPVHDEYLTRVMAGGELETDAGDQIGGAVAWERGTVSMTGASGDVDRFLAGLHFRRDLGYGSRAASLGGGTFDSELARTLALPDGASALATSAPDGRFLAAHLQLDRRFERDSHSIRAIGDVGLTWLTRDPFSEGGGCYGLNVGCPDQTVLSINPMVEVAAPVRGNGVSGEVRANLGIPALIGNDAAIEAAFLGAGSRGTTFRIANERTDLFANLGAALDLALSDTATLGAGIRLRSAEGRRKAAGSRRLLEG
jgi:uncharacterized protein with beta-barrel porin domain